MSRTQRWLRWGAAAALCASVGVCTAQAEETKKDAKQSASDHVVSVRPSLASMGYADMQDLPGIVVSPEDMFDDRGPGATCNTWSAGALPTTNPNNCQGLFGTATQVNVAANMIFSDLVGLIDSTGNGTFERVVQGAADNFNAVASGDVTGICFWGRYADFTLGSFVAPPAVGVQAFRIRYFRDGGGFPCEPIATFDVGGANPTAGTSISRVANGPTGSFFRYSVVHPPVAVNAGECIWVEIAGNTPNTTQVFAWVSEGVDSGRGDNKHAERFIRGTYAPEDVGGTKDLAFCVTLALNTSPNCNQNISTPSNDDPGSATALTIGAPAVPASNVGANPDVAPPCLSELVDADGVWFSVTGNGQTLSVSTDGSRCLDTRVIVYDATGFDMTSDPASLLCVAANDDDPAGGDLDSLATWCSGNGTHYLIFVSGLQPVGFTADGGFLLSDDEGNFQIAVAASGACNTPTNNSCEITAQPGDISETEVCGAATNDDCAGATPAPTEPEFINVGETHFATAFADALQRDFDFFNFSPASVVEVDITVRAEFPGLLGIFDCSTGDILDAFAFDACQNDPAVRVQLQPGDFGLAVIPGSFSGVPCFQNWGNYRISVTTVPFGACCVGSVCSINTEIACGDANGRYLGDATDCDPDECPAPCNITLGTPAEAEACLADPATSANSSCDTNAGTLTLGQPGFGTLSTDGANGTRDIDGWAFTHAGGDLDVTLTAQSPALFQLLNCPAGTVATTIGAFDRCDTMPVTVANLPAGDYLALVTTQDFAGAPCGSGVNNYSLTVAAGGVVLTPCQKAASYAGDTGLVEVGD
ncbi:MAG TPA: hypothetical protein PL072_03930, partial [Phycisphaerales bacterium]|nr:hypothetical protein [Phycisphaerales bacterium]